MTERAFGQTGIAWALILVTLTSGCLKDTAALHYLGEENLNYYRDSATQIEFSDVQQESPEQVIATQEPRTVNNRAHDEIWELPLSEAILIALQNNRIIRQNGTFMSPGNALFTNPDRISSVYDPAIQESGFLFGGRGVEAALAAFDARWDTTLLWGRNSNYLNNATTPGFFNTAETGSFSTGLLKNFGYGGQIALSHDVDYLGTNLSSAMFPSSYVGRLTAQYRHPLLAGSGAEFTRIAGPITQSFGGITGVTQGVLIARINQDITLADFESSVRNLVRDVETQYWDLYLAYLQYDTAVNARRSAQRTWRDLKEEVEISDGTRRDDQENEPIQKMAYQQSNPFGTLQPQSPQRNVKAEEAQARDAYYQARAATERALSAIYSNESQFRRLLGLPVNDGKVIRPLGDPLTGEFVPNFYTSLAEALTNRVELRKQKWAIKSLDLQLIAAKSLTRPRLDLVGSAGLNGFGDDLLDEHTTDPISGAGLNNMYGTLTRGDQTNWGVGFEMSVPIGFRSAHAQVRNIELRLAKAREVLSVQEMDISHELARSIQNLTLSYQNTQTLHNRWIAATEFVRIRSEEKKAGISNTDLLLRAITSQAQAESAYHTSLIEYNKDLAEFEYRKGTLLEYNNIYLAEDNWDPEAYQDALRRARERSSAIENPLLETQPPTFSTGSYNYQEVSFEDRIESENQEQDAAPVELRSVPATPPPPAPASQNPEAAQVRPGTTASEPGFTRTAPTTHTNQAAVQSAELRHEGAVNSDNPVELLSVSLDFGPEPATTAPTPVNQLPAAEQKSQAPLARTAIEEQRPVLQPLPLMFRATSATNPAPRVRPVPPEKLMQTRRPLVRSPQVATTQPKPTRLQTAGVQSPQPQTVKSQPKPPEPTTIDPQPAPRTPTTHHATERAVAPPPPTPKPSGTQPPAATRTPTAPPPPETAPPAAYPPEVPVRKAPAPRRATEIELFE